MLGTRPFPQTLRRSGAAFTRFLPLRYFPDTLIAVNNHPVDNLPLWNVKDALLRWGDIPIRIRRSDQILDLTLANGQSP